MRRFTRLTNGFSKKVENHAYAVALHMMYYDFVKMHSKLGMSPAMAAGVSLKLWEIGDIVALVETDEAKAERTCGPYKKKISDCPTIRPAGRLHSRMHGAITCSNSPSISREWALPDPLFFVAFDRVTR